MGTRPPWDIDLSHRLCQAMQHTVGKSYTACTAPSRYVQTTPLPRGGRRVRWMCGTHDLYQGRRNLAEAYPHLSRDEVAALDRSLKEDA